MKRPSAELIRDSLAKCATGIKGFDEITNGGLPKGRPTLVCGSAGCGKTILSMEFLVRGALEFDEPGVFMAFEETAEELTQNVASLGFNLSELIARRKIAIDYVRVERSEIEETGEYDLEGLFIRLDFAINSVGARRVVLDTIESLFSGLTNTAIVRTELRRLFRWLKDKGVTAIVAAERGDKMLTHQGLEEYVSDCVILLDHRVDEEQFIRRLRVVKYRGSAHGTNEYPFLIDQNGITILPVTSLGLSYNVNNERVSTGIARLDEMLGGKGYFRGSIVLITGTPGVGKTTLAAHFANACGLRGELCIYSAFEESEQQILRKLEIFPTCIGHWLDWICGQDPKSKAMTAPADSDVERFNPAKTRRKKVRYTLRLYVAGFRQRSRNAIANIRSICDKHFEGRADLEIIDLYQQPELAAAQQVIVTPTLIKEAPAPLRRMIGDLSDTSKVLAALGVRVHPPA